jgi:hypothetical protein
MRPSEGGRFWNLMLPSVGDSNQSNSRLARGAGLFEWRNAVCSVL